MYSPRDTETNMTDEEPTSILRVFGDFNSRVRSSVAGNSLTQPRNIIRSGASTSASQRLR